MQVIYGGASAFDALVYGEQHHANQSYFQQQLQNISSTLTDAGRSFFADAHVLYNQFNGSEAMRKIRAAVNAATGLFQPNRVRYVHDLGEMQNAPFVMQRYIMASPVVREKYHSQQIDGYSETYEDMQPGKIGDNHYDYRRVMDGVLREDTEGWYVKFYPDEIYEGDKELSHDEKVDIIGTWDAIEAFLSVAKGEDPTSVWGNKL